jgi:hypothetical protein
MKHMKLYVTQNFFFSDRRIADELSAEPDRVRPQTGASGPDRVRDRGPAECQVQHLRQACVSSADDRLPPLLPPLIFLLYLTAQSGESGP